MRAPLWVLCACACACAADRRTRPPPAPFVADALGQRLPAGAGAGGGGGGGGAPGPAVGSPGALLAPDRYEFYTFDESGELVKRLMTLDEIQAIVAAGDEAEGVLRPPHGAGAVGAPPPPPHTVVHRVVASVQSVLQAQLEAHRTRPPHAPAHPLDTPDVSATWSQILPSVFGNTGQAIAPDPAHAHAHSPHTTPDTELKEADTALAAGDAATPAGSDTATATAGVTQTLSTTARLTTTRPPPSASPTRPTTTARPTTTTRPTTRPPPPPTHYTTPVPTTRVQPVSSTTPRPPTTPKATTPRTTTPPTSRPRPPPSRPPPPTPAEHRVRVTPRPTTAPPHSTASEQHKPTHKHSADNFTRVQTVSPSSASTAARPAHYDKLSTLSPPSTAGAPHTDKAPQKRPQPPTSPAPTVSSAPPTRRPVAPPSAAPGQPPPPTTATPVAPPPPAPVQRVPRPPPGPPAAPPSPAAPPPAQPPSTTFKPPATTSRNMLSTLKEAGAGVNATAVTTQSVSPSTAAPRPEPSPTPSPTPAPAPAVKDGEPEIPLFDVAQSISQIASDLGNYRPSPTPNDLLLDTTLLSDLGAESKENLEIEIPPDVEKGIDTKPSDATEKNPNVFVQISTLDPHSSNDKAVAGVKEAPSKTDNVPVTTIKADLIASTPIDPVLSESMDDLLSQVVHQAPQAVVDTKQNHSTGAQHSSTTERNGETTTELNLKPNATKNNSFVPEINTPTKNTEFLSKNDIEESKVPTTIKITQISPLKPLDQNDIKIQNKESVENVDKNENYVQISKSTDKNNSKSDSDAIESTFSSGANTSHAKDRDEQVQSTKEPTFAKHDKQSISNSGQFENNKFLNTRESPSAAPPRKDDSGDLKKIPTTSSQSVNKIISAENNKIIHSTEKGPAPAPAPAPAPEARPKVEEFKKKIQKVNIDEKELANDRNTSWKLIPAVAPPQPSPAPALGPAPAPAPARDVVLAAASEHQGLDATPAGRGEDEARFTELCNELAFEYWRAMSADREPGRSFVMSPYAVTSALALVFMGARGATAGELNDLLRLDDMVTFNPHAALRNVSESIACGPAAGVRVAAFVRELLAERAAAGAVRAAFRDRAQRFYDAHVEEVDFALIGDVVRRRTNLLVRRHTHGLVAEYLKDNAIAPRPPLAALSVNIFQTDCSESSVEGRDGEMYFAVSPGVRQRRLVPVPAAVYRRGFLAGYDPALDATAAALGPASATLSTVLLMPGQQGNAVRADDLAALERRLLSGGGGGPVVAWRRALRTLLPRSGLELQVPRFAHRSVVNATRALRRLGLRALFEAGRADLAGLAGARVHLADVLQDTSFATCGEGGGALGPRHHVEEYPAPGEAAAGRREARGADGWPGPGDYQRAFHDPHDAGLAARLPLHLRPRQARLPLAPPASGPGPAPPAPAPARLKFDRPFLYLVRHNPTGMVLYMGRHDPRLMP